MPSFEVVRQGIRYDCAYLVILVKFESAFRCFQEQKSGFRGPALRLQQYA